MEPLQQEGDRIRHIRESRGLTPRRASIGARITLAYYEKIESNVCRASDRTIRQIAGALSADPSKIRKECALW